MTTPSDPPSLFMRKAERALVGAGLLLESGDLAGASSRAYYAMFDAARAALASVRTDLGPGIKTHRGLIGAFGEHVVLSGHVDVALGRSLNQAEKLRLMADYLSEPLTLDDARWAVAEAERFLAEIKRRFPDL